MDESLVNTHYHTNLADSSLTWIYPMLCPRNQQIAKRKSERVPQKLDNSKNDSIWNKVVHWGTYPISDG